LQFRVAPLPGAVSMGLKVAVLVQKVQLSLTWRKLDILVKGETGKG
jgi:hypothetical protein